MATLTMILKGLSWPPALAEEKRDTPTAPWERGAENGKPGPPNPHPHLAVKIKLFPA